MVADAFKGPLVYRKAVLFVISGGRQVYRSRSSSSSSVVGNSVCLCVCLDVTYVEHGFHALSWIGSGDGQGLSSIEVFCRKYTQTKYYYSGFEFFPRQLVIIKPKL